MVLQCATLTRYSDLADGIWDLVADGVNDTNASSDVSIADFERCDGHLDNDWLGDIPRAVLWYGSSTFGVASSPRGSGKAWHACLRLQKLQIHKLWAALGLLQLTEGPSWSTYTDPGHVEEGERPPECPHRTELRHCQLDEDACGCSAQGKGMVDVKAVQRLAGEV